MTKKTVLLLSLLILSFTILSIIIVPNETYGSEVTLDNPGYRMCSAEKQTNTYIDFNGNEKNNIITINGDEFYVAGGYVILISNNSFFMMDSQGGISFNVVLDKTCGSYYWRNMHITIDSDSKIMGIFNDETNESFVSNYSWAFFFDPNGDYSLCSYEYVDFYIKTYDEIYGIYNNDFFASYHGNKVTLVNEDICYAEIKTTDVRYIYEVKQMKITPDYNTSSYTISCNIGGKDYEITPNIFVVNNNVNGIVNYSKIVTERYAIIALLLIIDLTAIILLTKFIDKQ